MKLVTALLLAACLQISAYDGYTQESITLSEKNAKITDIFRKITKQTGYYFAHRDEWLAGARAVDIEVVNSEYLQIRDYQELAKERATGSFVKVDNKLINPNDIESITILRGAAAASIWVRELATG